MICEATESGQDFDRDSLDGEDRRSESARSKHENIPTVSTTNNSNDENLSPDSDGLICSAFESENVSKLPKVQLQRNSNQSKEKVLDFRDLIRKRLQYKGSNFGSMKFKDFKEAKKSFKKELNFDKSKSRSQQSTTKKAKMDSTQSTGFVTQRMHEMKRTISELAKQVDRLETKTKALSYRSNLIKTRKSVFPSNDVIVDQSSDENSDSEPSDSLNSTEIDEVPDSLEESLDEIAESDLEEMSPRSDEKAYKSKSDVFDSSKNKVTKSNEKNNPFIKIRQTLCAKDCVSIYANETILVESSSPIINETINSNVNSLKSENLSINDTFESANGESLPAEDDSATKISKKREKTLDPQCECVNANGIDLISQQINQVCPLHRRTSSNTSDNVRQVRENFNFPSRRNGSRARKVTPRTASKKSPNSVDVRRHVKPLDLYSDFKDEIDLQSKRSSNVLHSTRLEL